jgi:hypothetical protein
MAARKKAARKKSAAKIGLQGQWIGRYSGTNTGDAVLELDAVGSNFEGWVYIYDDRQEIPPIAAFVVIPSGKTKYSNTALQLTPLDPTTGEFTQLAHLQARFPGITMPATANSDWVLGTDTIRAQWQTNIGTNGEGILHKVDGSKPSELVPLAVNTWEDFRRYVRDLEPYRFIFRGQENSKWRLRTSFHRTDRSDLVKYMRVDVNALHQNLSSLTQHIFNLTNPIDYGAFISLIQHHGYPTPLLDWTYSPFIGAYFAFKRAKQAGTKVRIFLFDRQQWLDDWRQLQKITPARLHFSILNATAINNPRMVPQQALASVTNAEDIEGYINKKALEKGNRNYLQAIDLPVEQRAEALT